jgi:hypothetical protein
MNAKILLLQELMEDIPNILDDYKIILDSLGYENSTCRDTNKLPEIMQIFEPDIVFWIYPRSNAIEGMLQQYRHNDNLKVVWIDDQYGGRIVGDISTYCDRFLIRVALSADEFQKVIIELFDDQ